MPKVKNGQSGPQETPQGGAPASDARFVAVSNVKGRGKYYAPGTPIPGDALTETQIQALLAAQAIQPIEEKP